MKFVQLLYLGLLLTLQACHSNAQSTPMTDKKDKNFSCDIDAGLCQPTKAAAIEEIEIVPTQKVKLIYYTDPICSACWAIEPQLRKFKLAYGNYLDIEYKMGGLLPGWEGFADKANGISQPSDVAHHWDEVGQHSGMSIDGDVWLEDPLASSFPPSIAFKAAQKQGKAFSLKFLRKIREKLFLEKKNITETSYLVQATKECGGNPEQFLKDYRDQATEQAFLEERQQGSVYGVRGFPTFIFIGKDGKGFKISGMSGYENYVLALEKAYGEKLTAQTIQHTELSLLEQYGLLATKEIAFVLSQAERLTQANLEKLVTAGKVVRESQKFGDFWRVVTAD